MFEDAGQQPEECIIVEDRPRYLKMAKKTGTNVIQACITQEYKPVVSHFYFDTKDLLKVISQIIKQSKK